MTHLANRIQDSFKTTYPECPSCKGKLEAPVKIDGDIMADCLHCYISWRLLIGTHGYKIARASWVDPTHIRIADECL